MKRHVSPWKSQEHSEQLRDLSSEVIDLAEDRNLRYSATIKPYRFSFYYYGQHPFPDSWTIRHMPTMGAFEANYFAPSSEAIPRIIRISETCPDSPLVKQFLDISKRYGKSKGTIFNSTFLTKDFLEIRAPFLEYIENLESQAAISFPSHSILSE